MSTPGLMHGTQRSKDGTRVRDVVSHDGGKTWVLDAQNPPEPSGADEGADAAAGRANMAEQEAETRDIEGAAPAAQDPTDFDPSRLGGAPTQSGVLAAAEERLAAQQAADAEDAARPPPPEPMTPLAAFSTMFGQGATLGAGDEIAPAMGNTPDSYADPTGGLGVQPYVPKGRPGREEAASDIPRTYAGPRAEEAQRAEMRGDVEKAKAEDPMYAGTVGQVLGGAAATLPLAAFGMPASTLGRMAVGGGEGLVLGGVEGASSANPGERLEGGAMGAGAGVIGGSAAGALPLDKVAQGVGDWASRKRLTSTGIGSGDYNKLVSQGRPGAAADGVEQSIGQRVRSATTGPEAMGEVMEDVGLTGGVSTRGYWKQAEKVRLEAGDEIDAIVREIDSVPQPTADMPTPAGSPRAVTVDLVPVGKRLQAEAQQARKLLTPEGDKMAKDLEQRAAALLEGTGSSDYKTVWQTRVALDELAFDAEGIGQKNTPIAKTLRRVAGDLQNQLEAAVAKDRPDLLNPLRDANKRYSAASKVSRFSGQAQGARETGDPSVGEVGLAKSSPGAAGFLAGMRSVGDRAGAYTGRGAQKSLAAFPGAMGYAGAQMLPEDLEPED